MLQIGQMLIRIKRLKLFGNFYHYWGLEIPPDLARSYGPVLSHCVYIQDPVHLAGEQWQRHNDARNASAGVLSRARGKVGHAGKERGAHLNKILQY